MKWSKKLFAWLMCFGIAGSGVSAYLLSKKPAEANADDLVIPADYTLVTSTNIASTLSSGDKIVIVLSSLGGVNGYWGNDATTAVSSSDWTQFVVTMNQGSTQFAAYSETLKKYITNNASNKFTIGKTDATTYCNVNSDGAFGYKDSDGTQRFLCKNGNYLRCYKSINDGFCPFLTYKVPAAKTLASITVGTAPTKTVYNEDELFNPSGMVINKVFNDSSTEATTKYTYSPTGPLSSTDTAITITLDDDTTKTCTQAITVNVRTLQNVYFAEGCDMSKKAYLKSEAWNYDGLVVMAHYDTGEDTNITSYEQLTWNPSVATPTVGTTSITLTATFGGKTSISKTISGITVSNLLTNTFDLTQDNGKITTSTTEKVEFTEGEMIFTINKGTSSTPANNYCPTSSTSQTSTRIYNNENIAIDSGAGNIIQSVVITCTTISYATALSDNSVWTGGTATANETIVTVAAKGKPQAITASISKTVGMSEIKVNYFPGSDGTAALLAEYIMAENVEGQCNSKFAVAKSRYLAMSAAEQAAFKDTAAYDLAQTRYEAWALNKGQKPYAEGAISNGFFAIGDVKQNSSVIALVSLITAMAVSGIAGCVFMGKKRKKNQD